MIDTHRFHSLSSNLYVCYTFITTPSKQYSLNYGPHYCSAMFLRGNLSFAKMHVLAPWTTRYGAIKLTLKKRLKTFVTGGYRFVPHKIGLHQHIGYLTNI